MTQPLSKPIALMRPLLPQYEFIVPYLQQIDANRWYSNFGPLVNGLEARLAEFFGTGEGSVVTLSNGTAGLTNIMRALDLPRGSLCLLPSWTFIATPAAAAAAGLTPYFIDVQESTWALDPAEVKQHVAALNGKVSVVIVVAPFGAPQNTQAWDDFTTETGVPVIIDAAAGFDAFSSVPEARPRQTPVMISMHATKMFGAGEGGVIISEDTALIARVREMSNFGFSGTRSIRVPGTNGKMSEYTAAVAHATLDLWPQTREAWLCLKGFYAEQFRKVTALTGANPWLADNWVSSTFNIRLREKNAKQVIEQLVANGIESRQWWGQGCHAHPAYAWFPRAPLPVTEALGQSLLALPFSLDLHKPHIDYIMETFCKVYQEL